MFVVTLTYVADLAAIERSHAAAIEQDRLLAGRKTGHVDLLHAAVRLESATT
jgi:hypothetical protein